MKKLIEEFILKSYGVKADYPFKEDDSAVFRNARNKKWFAIIMNVSARKIGLDSDELIYIMNLKNHPANVCMLLGAKGIYPAYHMNKENWLTVCLEKDTIPLEMIYDLINQSYELIDVKRK